MSATPGTAPRAASILLAEHGLRAVLTLLLAWWMARELGPAAFGWLNLASAWAAIGFVVMGLGLDLPLVLRLASGRPAHRLLAAALAWRALAAAVFCAIAAGAAWRLSPQDEAARAVLLVVVLSVPAYLPCTLDLPFRARNHVLPLALARGGATLLAAGAKALALWWGAELRVLAWLVVAEAALASLLVARQWWIRVRVSAHSPTATRTGATRRQPTWARLLRSVRAMRRLGRPLLGRGLPQLAATLAAAAHAKAELLVLAALGAGGTAVLAAGAAGPSSEALGHYALAQKFAEVLLLLPVLALDALLPTLASRSQGDPAGAAQHLFDTAFSLSAVAALLAWLLAPLLIPTLLGEAYGEAVPLMQWLGLAAIGMALDAARRRWLAWQGLQHLAWPLSAGGLLLAVALASWWVPLAGAQGAAAAALLSWTLPALAAPWLHPAARPLATLQLQALWPWARWLTRAAAGRTGSHSMRSKRAGAAPMVDGPSPADRGGR